MAEHEYYEVNGRQIRVRPTESGQEIDEYGNFHRQPNHFTKGFGEGENPVEADRYILFWGKGCNWSNRASIARELLGLDKATREISIRSLPKARMKKHGCFYIEERNFQKIKYKRLEK